MTKKIRFFESSKPICPLKRFEKLSSEPEELQGNYWANYFQFFFTWIDNFCKEGNILFKDHFLIWIKNWIFKNMIIEIWAIFQNTEISIWESLKNKS